MSEKRRDNKGRLLRQGELQRSDGKYEYRYYDEKGERKSVYSWKLVDTDRIPSGKRCNESLRSMEKRIRRDLEDGIHTHEADRTTLNGHFDRYIAQKIEIKESTRGNYKYMYDTFCTRFCENEKDLKVIQEIMGHADITTTMNIYNEATKERKVASFVNLEGKIRVS